MDLKTILRIAAHAAAGVVLSGVAAATASGQTLLLTQSNATVLRGGTVRRHEPVVRPGLEHPREHRLRLTSAGLF